MFLPPYSSILEHPQIIKYFKGAYSLRPPTQKVRFVWDVKILFDYFSHKERNDQLSDKSLNKLLILFLLLGGQRMNTAYFFTLGRVTVTDIGVTFSSNHVLKHPLLGLSQRKVMCYCRLFKKNLKYRNTKVQADAKAIFIKARFNEKMVLVLANLLPAQLLLGKQVS